MRHKIKAVMIGHAVGDALGVPVEGCPREELDKNPVTDMRGFGSYDVPSGAWSDDTSMSLAALDSLANGAIDYSEIMLNFTKWIVNGEYTPTGECFDINKESVRRKNWICFPFRSASITKSTSRIRAIFNLTDTKGANRLVQQLLLCF